MKVFLNEERVNVKKMVGLVSEPMSKKENSWGKKKGKSVILV